jgi:rfaE bifunctional protein kinase chain/domain
MKTLSKTEIKNIIEKFQNKKIVVLGDLMLDRYFWGKVTRVSPEAPVPVVDIQRETYHMGGAANVASNLKSLGVNAYLCGLVGNDSYGEKFNELAQESGINVKGLYLDSDRPTTVKTRVFGNNQQIVRLDTESKKTVSNKAERHILNTMEEIEGIDAIIFSDYNKGCLSEIVIREIITQARNRDIPIFVDPKFTNFFEYNNVTLVKPNKKEAEEALNLKFNDVDSINKAGKQLLKKLNVENVLLTLGADGMVLFEKNGNITSIPTKARSVADVSGAGDTAIASFAATYVATVDVKLASQIANISSGIVCEKPGIVSITKEELIASN